MAKTDLTVKQVAEELGIRRETVEKLIARGDLSAYRVDLKQWRITREALDAFKASGGVKKPGRPRKDEAGND